MEAQNIIHNKKRSMIRQQSSRQDSSRQEPVKAKKSRERPQSPLSPMIYADVYDPLSKKDKSKKSKKLSSRELEDKLNNLDLLEQDVLPTQVKYGPQDSVPQSRHYRKPGQLISNSLFDGEDMVDPTIPGVSSRSSGRRVAGGGGGGDSDDSDSSDDDPRPSGQDRYPQKKGSKSSRGASGGDNPPGGDFVFP